MKKILIVDDDVIIRLTFNKVLNSKKFIIKQAKSVNEAIQSLKAEKFDLVLLDIKLPPDGWEGGYKILKRKKKIMLNESTPVIIVSGELTEESVLQKVSLEDNIARIFIKPVENEHLRAAVLHALGMETL
jgi:DNA-binding NtrC family response regulator